MPLTANRLRDLIERLELPKQRVILIHARLKRLQQHSQLPYTQLTQALVQALQQTYQPHALLIPAYTIYTFMRTRLFHCLFSHSDSGRFSEEVRQHIAHWRSPDPMYSVLDLNHYLPQFEIDYRATFAERGLFAHLHEHKAIILNIDMCGFWATPIHRVELKNQVDYRHLQTFDGIVYSDEKHWQAVDYTAYLRQIDAQYRAYPLYDQHKRLAFLLEKQVLHSQAQEGISLRWTEVQTFEQSIHQALQKDPHFLLADEQDQSPQAALWLT